MRQEWTLSLLLLIEEDVAKHWTHCAGHYCHTNMRPTFHGVWVVRGLAALFVQVQVPTGTSW